jgi:NAD-dependent DNA ligase
MDLDEIGEGEGEELEEEESIGEEDDLYTYEERKLNYTTELANFSDYQTISKMLG